MASLPREKAPSRKAPAQLTERMHPARSRVEIGLRYRPVLLSPLRRLPHRHWWRYHTSGSPQSSSGLVEWRECWLCQEQQSRFAGGGIDDPDGPAGWRPPITTAWS
jgi:hypothetical protein